MPRKNILCELAKKKRIRAAGLMSGTSADGVDAAILDIQGGTIRLVAQGMFPYPAKLRGELFKLFRYQTATVEQVSHYNFVLGEVFAQALIMLCRKSGVDLHSIDVVGSHGQTIYHNPRGRRFGRKKIGSTLQIGEPSIIAQRVGIATVADFRPRDMAVGGEGAPLVPYADFVLFQHRSRHRAIQNIGGIANVTWLPASGMPDDILAFDTGPGNMMIDRIICRITRGKQAYDCNGNLASRGTVDFDLLYGMQKHPFFRRRPPKSTGREEFGWPYADAFYFQAKEKKLSPADIAATATALTATTIAQAYKRFLPAMPDEVILCGGGSHNKTLVRMLQELLNIAKIIPMDDLGIPADAKEAVSFAILAHAAIKGIAGNVPAATGAKQPVILGKIIPVL